MLRFNALHNSFLRDLRGATLIEFSFAFPILMMFCLGILDLSQIVSGSVNFSDTLRQSARSVVVTDQDCPSQVMNKLEQGLETEFWGTALKGSPTCSKQSTTLGSDICVITAMGSVPCLLCSMWRGTSSQRLEFKKSVIVAIENPDAC